MFRLEEKNCFARSDYTNFVLTDELPEIPQHIEENSIYFVTYHFIALADNFVHRNYLMFVNEQRFYVFMRLEVVPLYE